MLPPFVGTNLNETLGWLGKATEQEVMSFYSNMDNYPISRFPVNHRMLLALVAQRAAELDMEIVVSPGRNNKHYSEADEEQLRFESLAPPDEDHDEPPPDEDHDEVPSARFAGAVTVASLLTKSYGSGRDSEAGDTTLVVLDDAVNITLFDILNLSWVFLHLTSVSEESV